MYRSLFSRPDRYGDRRQRRRWPRSRAGGCLLWIVLLIVILIVLSVLFGGFQKGTKAASLGPFHDHGQFGANNAQNWP
jgi:hypothetical protein